MQNCDVKYLYLDNINKLNNAPGDFLRQGEEEMMLNPYMKIPEIDHFEVYNNISMKVWFVGYKDKNDYTKVTVQKDDTIMRDKFDMEIGLYIAISKYLFKGKLTSDAIESYGYCLMQFIAANKVVDKAIKEYNLQKKKKEDEIKEEVRKKEAFERRKAKKIAKKQKRLKEKEQIEREKFINDMTIALKRSQEKSLKDDNCTVSNSNSFITDAKKVDNYNIAADISNSGSSKEIKNLVFKAAGSQSKIIDKKVLSEDICEGLKEEDGIDLSLEDIYCILEKLEKYLLK